MAHPWIFDVRASTPPVGPNLVSWMEAGFQALSRARLALLLDGIERLATSRSPSLRRSHT